MMKLDRACLGVRHIAADTTVRYALDSVALQRQDGHSVAVGCGGSLVVAAETIGEDEGDIADISCLIAMKTAISLYRAIPKTRGVATVACEADKLSYVVPQRKGEPIQGVDARPGGTYPQWQNTLPWATARIPHAQVLLNGKLLAKLARALADFYEGDSRGNYQPVELSLPENPEASVMIRARRNDGRVMFGAIMPMQCEEWPVTETEQAFGAPKADETPA